MICFVHYIILWTASENEGIKKASTLRRAVNEVTQAMHSPIKQNGSMVVDAWYMRMYLNLSTEQPY